METHKVEVVKVKLEPHPNADSLSVVRIYGFTCCVRTEDWKDGDLGAYIQPDSIVDTQRPEFAFLGEHKRIKVKRLRGVISMGLLVKAPEGMEEGEDAAEALGVTHYEPPLQSCGTGGEAEPAPRGIFAPKYDVESMYRYAELFHDGEEVVATEKIHGANARFVYHQERMWAGSRSEWKAYNASNLWWSALKQNSWLEQFCGEHPELVVYGEVFGNVQSLKYGCGSGEYKIAVFDVLRETEWVGYDELRTWDKLQLVPLIYRGKFDLESLKGMAEGPSTIPGANHTREGIVVKPMIERYDMIGRVQLKLVSNSYLEKS